MWKLTARAGYCNKYTRGIQKPSTLADQLEGDAWARKWIIKHKAIQRVKSSGGKRVVA